MSIHSTLTGTDLHESKGAAAAAVNTVAVADGLGSAQWKTIPAAALNLSTFKNLNVTWVYLPLFNCSNSGFTFYAAYIPFACTITSASFLMGSPVATTAPGTTTVSLQNNGVGTFTTFSGGGAFSPGQTLTNAVTTNNNVVAGGIIFLSQSYSGTNTGTFPTSCSIVLTCTLV